MLVVLVCSVFALAFKVLASEKNVYDFSSNFDVSSRFETTSLSVGLAARMLRCKLRSVSTHVWGTTRGSIQ